MQHRSHLVSLTSAALAVAVSLTSLSSGCRAVKTVVDAPGNTINGVTSLGRDKQPVVDPVALQQSLLQLTDAFTTSITREIGPLKIADKSVDPTQILRWRTGFASSTCSIVSGANPVANLFDMTAYITLTRMALEAHWVPKLFGDSGLPLLESYRTAEQETWALIKTVMTPAQQDEFRKELEQWYQNNPYAENVVGIRATGLAGTMLSLTKSKSPHVGSLYDLVRIDPLSTLDPTTREIAQTRLFAERALYVSQKMPQLLRWQMELLSANALAAPAVQQLVDNTTQLTASVDRVSRVAEQLPVQIDQQRAAIMQGLEAQEKQLTPLVAEVNQAFDSGRDMSTSLNTTFVTFDALMKRFGVGEPPRPAPSGQTKKPAEPFRIQDYTESTAQLEKTAKQLTELLVTLNQTASAANLAQLSERVEPVVQQAQTSGKELVDYAFMRGLLLIVALLGSMLAYRYVSVRINAPTDGKKP